MFVCLDNGMAGSTYPPPPHASMASPGKRKKVEKLSQEGGTFVLSKDSIVFSKLFVHPDAIFVMTNKRIVVYWLSKPKHLIEQCESLYY